MKRRILLSCIALCSVVMSVVAQRSYNFNAVALNVDGLPESISGVTVNEGAPGADGATTMGNAIAKQNWDIVGFSEDFDYHNDLVAPLKNYFHVGTWRGKIDIGLGDILVQNSADTDGLGLLVSKRDGAGYTGETYVKWNTYNGYTDQGADGLIKKGFRYYAVTIASGIVVDVYILHMDADSGEADINARNSQLTQLATYIKNNKHGRPILIIGDTNCRYTRDAVKTNLIDAINADSRLTINDVWVEKVWGGEYPELGADAMMWTNAPYNNNTGEVVDKIFYINDSQSSLTIEANSYLHDTSFGVSDHYPVIANFTITDPKGTATNSSSWLVNGGVIVENENMLDGCQVTDGTTYYIKNVSTGLYLKSGATWGTQACEGSAGMPVKFTVLSDGKYELSTIGTETFVSAIATPYMDVTRAAAATRNESLSWTLQEVANTKYQYYLKISNTQALSSTSEGANGNGDHVVKCMTFNEDDDKQKWVLLTEERMKEEMALATESKPFDVTPLLKAASFDKMDIDNSYASTNWPGLTLVHWENGDVGGHNGCAQYVSTNALTVSQVLKAMPAGTYTVSFEGFYRAQAEKKGGSNWRPTYTLTEYTMDVPVSFGSGKVNLKQNINLDIDGDARWAFLADDSWLTTFSVTTTSTQNMTFQIAKPAFSSGDRNWNSWIAIDNFAIIYKGDGSEPENVLSVKAIVGNYINTMAQKVAKLNAKGQATYDITNVIYRYNNESLLSADGSAEFAMIDAAYEIALAAHKQGIIEEAMKSNGDVTTLITNPSFETGDLTGWTIAHYSSDTGVKDNLMVDWQGNLPYQTQGVDGSYLFNTWEGGDCTCSLIYQDIKGLRNGYYTLQAMVSSWEDRGVYLVGNNQHVGVATTSGTGTFVNLSLDFLVKNGEAKIGAVGSNKDGDFYYKQGIFFKVDNFRLAYKGEVGEGRVKIALADAKTKAAGLNPTSKAQFEKAVAKYENATVTGDGKTEETAIYDALKSAIASQPYANTDMTWLITNPSFETGDWTGWTKPEAWDAVVLHATHGNAPGNGEGQYVVNVWNDQAGIEGSGINKPTYQTLKGLPNGRYRLTADVASDGGNQVCLYATGSQTVNGAAASPENNWTFVKASVEFEVTDNADVTIGAVGLRNGEFNAEGGNWYKCDNFRLTYLGHDLSLNETGNAGTINDWYTKVDVARNITADKWSTFVVPFDMAKPEGWEVKALTSSEMTGENILLEFTEVESIEAGVPYMIRKKEGDNVTTISTTNVQVNTTLDTPPSTSHVEFVGVYEAGKIPAGAFFISNNQFWYAKDETNNIKAYRAYIQPKTANARAMNYRFDGEEGTTGIETEQADEEVTVVGIYTLGGVRLNDMQEGVNILQMSDGSTIKVVIK